MVRAAPGGARLHRALHGRREEGVGPGDGRHPVGRGERPPVEGHGPRHLQALRHKPRPERRGGPRHPEVARDRVGARVLRRRGDAGQGGVLRGGDCVPRRQRGADSPRPRHRQQHGPTHRQEDPGRLVDDPGPRRRGDVHEAPGDRVLPRPQVLRRRRAARRGGGATSPRPRGRSRDRGATRGRATSATGSWSPAGCRATSPPSSKRSGVSGSPPWKGATGTTCSRSRGTRSAGGRLGGGWGGTTRGSSS